MATKVRNLMMSMAHVAGDVGRSPVVDGLCMYHTYTVSLALRIQHVCIMHVPCTLVIYM